MAITETTTNPMERIELAPEQMVEIRRHKGRSALTPTQALRSAGITNRGAYIPIEGSIETHGKLVARVVPLDSDDPTPEDSVAIFGEGDATRGKGPALTTRLRDEDLEALGFDLDAVEDDERPRVIVWAGNGFIAFDRPGSETLEIPDRAPDDDGYLSIESREDLLRVWHETDGDVSAAAEMFAVAEAVVRDRFADAGLVDEDDA